MTLLLISKGPFRLFVFQMHNEIKKSITHTVVVRLLAGGLGHKGLEAAIKVVWRPKGQYTIRISKTTTT